MERASLQCSHSQTLSAPAETHYSENQDQGTTHGNETQGISQPMFSAILLDPWCYIQLQWKLRVLDFLLWKKSIGTYDRDVKIHVRL